ncbi:MAG: CHAT domain-containing protein [Lewinellaceae bacterium]|nr:CHAT domain-containing protein [Lewinellaceae bacterium]
MKKKHLAPFILLAALLAWTAFQPQQEETPDSVLIQKAISLDGLASEYKQKGEYRLAMACYDTILAIFQENFPESKEDIETLFYYKGHTYMQMDEYRRSLECFMESLSIQESLPGVSDSARAYNYQAVGVAYRCIGDYERAGQYFDKALAARLGSLGPDHPHVAATYMVTGRLYKELGEPEKAMELLDKALDIRLRKEQDKEYIANTYNTIAITLGDMGAYHRAIDTLRKALAIQGAEFGPGHPHVARSLSQVGQMFLRAGDYAQADLYLQKALDIQLDKLGPVNIATSHTFVNMALCRFGAGRFEEAVQWVDKALAGVKFTSMDRLDEVLSVNSLVISLGTKADFFRKQGQTAGAPQMLSEADSLYGLAVRALEHLQKTFHSDDSNVELINKRYSIFEGAIAANYLLGRMEAEGRQNAARAFLLSEQSKSFLLRQAYSGLTARQVLGVPDELLDREKQLKERITQYEKAVFEEMQKIGFDSARVNGSRDTLFRLSRQYDAFLERLKDNHAKYYNLKYGNNVIDVPEVQAQLLAPGQAMVEYFVGDSAIFIFLVQPDDYRIIRLENDFGLVPLARQMRDGIYYAILGGESHYDSLNRQYAEAAHLLYQKLAYPFDTLLDAGTELIIIPDGALSLVPFEALLKKLPEHPEDFRNHHYLLNDHAVSYAFSATMLKEMKSIQHDGAAAEGILFVAPAFGGESGAGVSGSSSGSLLRNQAELGALQAAFAVTSLTNEAATKEQFIESAKGFPVLHLAAHGQADQKVGDFSYIEFHAGDGGKEASKLYAGELYNLQINAELVVLSACETGLGEWRRGEGIVSLARGFTYAGAKSIVSSLWKVEDSSTGQLMARFYRNLRKGHAKSQALRQAKLDALRRSPNVEPFFWAGFVPAGDMSPLNRPGSSRRYLYTALALLALAALGLLFRRKKVPAR